MVPKVFEPLKFGCSSLLPLLVELCTSFHFTSIGFDFDLYVRQKLCHTISVDVCGVYPDKTGEVHGVNSGMGFVGFWGGYPLETPYRRF